MRDYLNKKHTIVPLGYSKELRRFYSHDQINRWEIGFVGSVTSNQGLDIMLEVMPELAKVYPAIVFTIIGQGNYSKDFGEKIRKHNLSDRINMLGFIKDEQQMVDRLAHCAIGLSLYTREGSSNADCADSGKPKLYSFIGVPQLVTDICSFKSYIKAANSVGMPIGKIVDYTKDSVIDGIKFLLDDTGRLQDYKQNSYWFAGQFLSDSIFNKAMEDTICS